MSKRFKVGDTCGVFDLESNNNKYCLNDIEICDLLNNQTERISELEEQLKNAIVPKFKVGQKVWFIHKGTEKIHNGIIEGFEMVKHLSDSIDEYYRIEYDDVCLTSMEFEGEFIFITKEEAKAKLKELRGKSK